MLGDSTLGAIAGDRAPADSSALSEEAAMMTPAHGCGGSMHVTAPRESFGPPQQRDSPTQPKALR